MLPFEVKASYFWDVDISNINADSSKRLIIKRVFSLGSIDEMKALISYYGDEIVIEQLCNCNYLDPKTLNFASKLFNIPKNEFRCYRRKRSNPQHWNS